MNNRFVGAGGEGGPGPLTRGPVARTLLVFALPLLATNVLQSLSASVNAVWVSRSLGEVALAATSNANLILFLLLGAVFGISMASNILVAQAVGAGDVDGAKRTIGASVSFFIALSLLVSAVGFVLTPSILRLVGTPGEAQGLAEAYLKVIFVAVPFMYFFTFLTMVLRGAGDARTPFIFMLVSVLLDVVLNPILILGPGLLPRLGIAGAAAATLISQAASLAGLIAYLYLTRHPLRLQAAEFGYLRPRWALLRVLITRGLPMGLEVLVYSSSALLMISQVNRYGAVTAAAYGVATQLWTYVQMPALAVAAAVSSMAAQCIGAGLWDRVGQIARAGVAINLLLTGALVALAYGLNGSALRLFLPDSPEAFAIAAHINRTVVWAFMLFGVTFVIFGVVRASGAMAPSLLIVSFSLLLLRPAFAWLMTPSLGADAIWWSFPLGTASSALLAVLYYRLGGWRRNRMLNSAAGEPPPDTALGTPTPDP